MVSSCRIDRLVYVQRRLRYNLFNSFACIVDLTGTISFIAVKSDPGDTCAYRQMLGQQVTAGLQDQRTSRHTSR